MAGVTGDPKPAAAAITWKDRSHTNASMIREGTYPPGTTREEVERLVRGSFGGRFEQFGDGRFKYVAYTD